MTNVLTRAGYALVLAALAPGGCALIGSDPDSGKALPLAGEDTRALGKRLRGHVEYLAGTIGERNLAHPGQLRHAEHYLAAQLARAGHVVRWQTFMLPRAGSVEPCGGNHRRVGTG